MLFHKENELKKYVKVNEIRNQNMKRLDYNLRNENVLIFKNFDKQTIKKSNDENSDFGSLSHNLKVLSFKEQSDPFPRNYISDCPDRLRYKIGLPNVNYFSSSSEEEKYKKSRVSTNSSECFVSYVELNIWAEKKVANLK